MDLKKFIKKERKKANVIGGSLEIQPKEKGGVFLEDRKVVRIYVEKKVDIETLKSKDIVEPSAKIDEEEIEVDVFELGEVKALSSPDPKKKYRPLVMGISTMNYKSRGACSLGAFAIDNETDNIVQLSNQHCFGLENKAVYGDPCGQPSLADGGDYNDDRTGKFLRGVELKYSEFTCAYRDALHRIYRALIFENENRVDVSCASINEGIEHLVQCVNGTVITGWKLPEKYGPDKPWAYGRSSGHSYDGKYIDTAGMLQVGYTRGKCQFVDVVIGLQSDTFKCIPGDSGSPWFEGDKIIGLRFAGSNIAWIGCKWRYIEQDLDVTFPHIP